MVVSLNVTVEQSKRLFCRNNPKKQAMVSIKKISLENKSDLEFVEKLYIESFPQEERRSVIKMHRLIVDESRFHFNVITDESDIRIGLITYWVFDSFIYVEHFALSSECRNRGYGKEALSALIESVKLPIVVEIELPSSSDFAKKRLGFYERLNFVRWDFSYQQPPYEEGFNPVPMLLLTYGDLDLNIHYDSVRDLLYTQVYDKK